MRIVMLSALLVALGCREDDGAGDRGRVTGVDDAAVSPDPALDAGRGSTDTVGADGEVPPAVLDGAPTPDGSVADGASERRCVAVPRSEYSASDARGEPYQFAGPIRVATGPAGEAYVGVPHISDADERRASYAVLEAQPVEEPDGLWLIDMTDTIDLQSDGNMGQPGAIAVDAAGEVHTIAYDDTAGLVYVSAAGVFVVEDTHYAMTDLDMVIDEVGTRHVLVGYTSTVEYLTFGDAEVERAFRPAPPAAFTGTLRPAFSRTTDGGVDPRVDLAHRAGMGVAGCISSEHDARSFWRPTDAPEITLTELDSSDTRYESHACDIALSDAGVHIVYSLRRERRRYVYYRNAERPDAAFGVEETLREEEANVWFSLAEHGTKPVLMHWEGGLFQLAVREEDGWHTTALTDGVTRPLFGLGDHQVDGTGGVNIAFVDGEGALQFMRVCI